MATPTRFFNSDSLHAKINQKAGTKLVQMEKFSLSVVGPDDRRLDKALADHQAVSDQLTRECEKAITVLIEKFVRVVTSLEQQAKSGEFKAVANRRMGVGSFYDHIAVLEKSVDAGCGKVWKDFLTKHADLRAIRFKPAVIYPDLYVTLAEAEAPEERVSPHEDEASAKELLDEWTQLAGKLEAAVKKSQENLAATGKSSAAINKTFDNVSAGYKAPKRESQQDDPQTDPEDEPDEGKLNQALFLRFADELEHAVSLAADGIRQLEAARENSDTGTKQITAFLKKYAKMMTMIGPSPATKIKLGRMTAQANDALNRLVEVVSKTKIVRKEYENAKALINALVKRKESALGLVERGKLSSPVPLPDLDQLLKTLKTTGNS